MAEIEEKIADEEYNELITLVDFNSDPNSGRFFKDLKYLIDVFELVCSDIDRLYHVILIHIKVETKFASLTG